MGRTKQDIGRLIKVDSFYPFLILIFLILNLCIIISLNIINKHTKININNIEALISFNKYEYEAKSLELSLIEESISDIENIDNKLTEIKSVYFQNAYLYEKKVLEGKGTKKIAYLTFDDGPSGYTNAFLRVLDEHDIFATFFLIGNTAERHSGIYEKISNSGHTIGNHTYTHRINNGIYRNADAFIKDVLRQEQFIYNKTGIKTDIVRFPGGSRTAAPKLRNNIVSKLKEMNYGYIDWNVASGDADGVEISKEGIYAYVVNGTKRRDVAVILMHDFYKNSLDILPSIIKELKRSDYIFLPLFYESAKVIK